MTFLGIRKLDAHQDSRGLYATLAGSHLGCSKVDSNRRYPPCCSHITIINNPLLATTRPRRRIRPYMNLIVPANGPGRGMLI